MEEGKVTEIRYQCQRVRLRIFNSPPSAKTLLGLCQPSCIYERNPTRIRLTKPQQTSLFSPCISSRFDAYRRKAIAVTKRPFQGQASNESGSRTTKSSSHPTSCPTCPNGIADSTASSQGVSKSTNRLELRIRWGKLNQSPTYHHMHRSGFASVAISLASSGEWPHALTQATSRGI